MLLKLRNLRRTCESGMRYVHLLSNHGTIVIVQVLLLLSLQTRAGHGKVYYHNTYRPAPWSNSLSAQEDEEATGTATIIGPIESPTTTASLPHIKALGFLPIGEKIQTPEEIEENLSKILNETRSHEEEDSKLWHDFILKTLKHNSTSVDRQRGDSRPQQRNSSQVEIPHLFQLGFGVSNTIKTSNSRVHAALSGTQQQSMAMHRMIVLGVGCFLGGVLVILLIFFLVYLKRRHSHQHGSASESDGDSKLCLLNHEMPSDAILQHITNELSSSTISTGSGDSNSQDSEPSYSTLQWHAIDDNISVYNLNQDQNYRCTPYINSPESGSPTSLWSSSTLVSGSESPILPDLERPSFFSCESDIVAPMCYPFEPINELETVPEMIECTTFSRTIPDILSSHAQLPESPDVITSSKILSKEGGIIFCQAGDVVVIVPPEALTGEHSIRVNVDCSSCSPTIKLNPRELLISPLVEIICQGVDLFSKSITVKIPYRVIVPSDNPSCLSDPLCNCIQTILELRYSGSNREPTKWNSASRSNTFEQCYWPECYDPVPSDENIDNMARVSFSCFSSTCTIVTNTPGKFCLLSPNHDSANLCSHLLDSYMPSYHFDHVRLCITVAAKYHVDYGSSQFDDLVFDLQQVHYLVVVSDRTAMGREKMHTAIQNFGGHRQSDLTPLDLRLGSEVKIKIANVHQESWPWKIATNSTYEIIPWSEIARGYGTITRAEFRCSPKTDDVRWSNTCNRNIMMDFSIETSHPSIGHDKSIVLTAHGGYSVAQ